MNGQPTCENVPIRTLQLTTRDLMVGTSETTIVLTRIEEKLFGYSEGNNSLIKQKEGFNVEEGLSEAESNLRNIFDRLLKLESRIGGNA